MDIRRHTTTEISLVALDVQNFAARREEHFQFNKCLFVFNGRWIMVVLVSGEKHSFKYLSFLGRVELLSMDQEVGPGRELTSTLFTRNLNLLVKGSPVNFHICVQ